MKSDKYPLILSLFLLIPSVSSGISINGTVKQKDESPVNGAIVKILNTNYFDTSNTDGSFIIEGDLSKIESPYTYGKKPSFIESGFPEISISSKRLSVINPYNTSCDIKLYSLNGRQLYSIATKESRVEKKLSLSRGAVIIRVNHMNKSYAERIILLKEKTSPFQLSNNRSQGSSSLYKNAGFFLYAEKGSLASRLYPLSSDTISSLDIVMENTGEYSPADFVDPFICTAGDHGQLYPGPTMPWGLVKPGPETSPGSHVGYDYNAERLKGFSHFRLGGIGGHGAGGSLMILPGTGSYNYDVAMNKETEIARPGYYSINSGNPEIKSEMTATRNAAFHRYTFPESDSSFIFFDFIHSYGNDITTPEYTITDSNQISGVLTGNQPSDPMGTYTLYFNILTNKKFTLINSDSYYLTGRFSTSQGETVKIKVGISPVNIETAIKNRENELPDWNFDTIKNLAENEWNSVLSKIEVNGNNRYKKLFYTHLYHSYTLPFLVADSSYKYRDRDGNIYTAERPHYDSWSIWDTFRTKYPLLSITEPQRYQDMANSLSACYARGTLRATGNNQPVPTVRTDHALCVISDSYTKGLTDISISQSYDSIKSYVVGHKFEQAMDHWCIAQIAEILELSNEADLHLDSSQMWKQTWNDEFKELMNDSLADIVGEGGYEGTKWQYRWFVPHDPKGLIAQAGGNEQFISELQYFFNNDLYNHGNEPDIQVPYLFNIAGAPWLTQKWTKKIMSREMTQLYGTHDFFSEPYNGLIYKITPDGYIPEMDDDAGTMSAWFVLSAMGIYQLCPGDPVFLIGTPLFESIVIHAGDNDFTITAENISDENYYIQSATLNGNILEKPWLDYQEIVSGGELILEMGPEPDTAWGASAIYP